MQASSLHIKLSSVAIYPLSVLLFEPIKIRKGVFEEAKQLTGYKATPEANPLSANNAKVEVSGINTEVTYDATNNRVTNSGTASTITLGQETSGSTTYEAIVPSNMTVNNPNVTITLNDFPETGKTRTFSCTLSSVTFAKGNKYTFTLTLHNEIVVSQPTISEWTKDEATNMTIPQAKPS